MGLYAPTQIVRDVQQHGVEVRPVDVNLSQWDSTLGVHAASTGGLGMRLGLRVTSALYQEEGQWLVKVHDAGNGEPSPLSRR